MSSIFRGDNILTLGQDPFMGIVDLIEKEPNTLVRKFLKEIYRLYNSNPEIFFKTEEVLRKMSLEKDARFVVEYFRVALNKFLADKNGDLSNGIPLKMPNRLVIRQPVMVDTNARFYPVPQDFSHIDSIDDESKLETPKLDEKPKLIELSESNIKALNGKVFVLLIIGPPRSGKSTVAVSLSFAMGVCARSFMNSSTWRRERVINTPFYNADLGTPVSPLIINAEISNILHLPKHKWTVGMAWQAVECIEKHKRNVRENEAKILVVDMPGGGKHGDITDVIKIISSVGDGGILIHNSGVSDNTVANWRALMRDLGIPLYAKLESYLVKDAGTMSVMTKDVDERRVLVEGRLSLIPRTFQPWDPVISFLAPYLMFRAIPQTMRDRYVLVVPQAIK